MNLQRILILCSFGLLLAFSCQSSKQGALKEIEASFGSFLYQYSSDARFQYNHISFPLEVVAGEATDVLEPAQWRIERLGFGVEFSTILFQDSTISFDQELYSVVDENHVRVTAFFMKQFTQKQYDFKRNEGSWALDRIEFLPPMPVMDEEEDFWKFLHRFISEPDFGKKRVAADAMYVVGEIETDEEQTQAFDPEVDLPRDPYLFEEIFTPDSTLSYSPYRSIYIKGEGTGYHMELYFQLFDQFWYLTKIKNLGR